MRVRPTSGSLTIGAGITVRNAPGSDFTTLGNPALPLILEGKVSAQSSTLRVTGLTVTNSGTLESLAGRLQVLNLTDNVNGTSITNGNLDLQGTYTFNVPVNVSTGSLTLDGDWINASTITQSGGSIRVNGNWDNNGTIHQTGGTIFLGGTFTVAAMGTFTGTAGTVAIVGTLEDAAPPVGLSDSDVLTIDAARTWQLAGATIRGVTIEGETPTTLLNIVSTSTNTTLDGVTLSVNTTIRVGAAGGSTPNQAGNQVTVVNGLMLDNSLLRLERTSTSFSFDFNVGLNFSGGAQTLGGTGTVELYGDDARTFGNSFIRLIDESLVRVRPTGVGASLTIGPGITVRNAANSYFTTLGDPTLPLVIQGTVTAQATTGQSLRVTGTAVTTALGSTLAVTAGELNVNNLSGNVHGTSILGGDLDLDGAYFLAQPVAVAAGSLTLRGDWDNNSTIHQTGETIFLGGTFTVADMGTFTGTSGTVQVFGTLSDPGATLTINAARTWQLAGATIRGVTIEGENPTTLLNIVSTSINSTLDGVTLSVNTTIRVGAAGGSTPNQAGNQVTVVNGLMLDNSLLRLERTSTSFSFDFNVGLNFSGGAQILGGTGTVELYGDDARTFGNSFIRLIDESLVRVRPTGVGASLTIGSGITVRNAANSYFTTLGDSTLPLVVQGTVTAQATTGQSLRVTGSAVATALGSTLAVSAGELDVNNLSGNVHGTSILGGDLDLDGAYFLAQPVAVAAGSLTLRGDWDNNSTIHQTGDTIFLGGTFTVADMGTFTGTAGTVQVFGTLNDPGATLTINAARTWQLAGATIRGVTIEGETSSALLNIVSTSINSTLDGVTLTVNTTIRVGAAGGSTPNQAGNQVTVLNGLTLDNSLLRLERTSTSFSFDFNVGLNFSGGAQILGGTGTVELYGDDARTFGNSFIRLIDESLVRVRPTGAGASLTIGSEITVRNAANSYFTTLGDPTLPLVIQGTVTAQATTGQSLRVTGSTVTNTGRLDSLAGTLDVNTADLLNQGMIVANAGSISVNPTRLHPAGGIIEANGGTVTVSPADTSTFLVNGSFDATGTIRRTDLAGGTWRAGPNSAVRLLYNRDTNKAVQIVNLAAAVELSGGGSNLVGGAAGSAFATFDALTRLTSIVGSGELTIRNGRSFVPTVDFNNAGILTIGPTSSFTPRFAPPEAIAIWTGDNTAADLYGRFNGTATNGASYVTGILGQSFSFDGVNDSIVVAPAAALRPTNTLTVNAHIFPTGSGNGESSSGGIIVNKEGEYEIAQFADGTIRWAFANTNPGWAWIDTGFIAPLNAWTRITVNYNNGVVRTYANGSLIHTFNGSGAIGDAATSQDEFRIGGRQGATQFFAGRIDEVGLFNVALTPAQIDALVLSGPINFTQTGGTTTVQTGGTLLTAGDALNLQGGTLAGTGTVRARVINTSGTVAPGNSPGNLTIDGDYTQGPGGTLLVELAGHDLNAEEPQFDQLRVTGTATLDGTVRAELLNEFEPTPGDTFRVLSSAQHIGRFATHDFPYPGGAFRQINPLYDTTGLTLQAQLVPPLDFVAATTGGVADGNLARASGVRPLWKLAT